ncbi:MAG: hemerythrin family protein [Desulfuromonadales bacterium]|nr:hemerythrin family protein [Desulfuromonadales bacterium]
MPQITWNTTFSLKNLELDEQHKRLVAIINNLHDTITQGQGLQSIREVFSALVITIKSHFISEEQLMRQYAFPGLAHHKQEHDNLIEQIDITSKRVAAGNNELTRDVQQYVASWWLSHIENDYREFGPFLKNKGLKQF